MDFASAYIGRGALFPKLIDDIPRSDTGVIVVIPAFNEPDIGLCLDSLARSEPPGVTSEVIIVVNYPPHATETEVNGTAETREKAERWSRSNRDTHFRLHICDLGSPGIKRWGVGLARKVGMDEAVRRFAAIGNRDGVIASLDADSFVETSYFRALKEDLGDNKGATGCSVMFIHRKPTCKSDMRLLAAITEYELHMRYFVNALRYTGYPYCHHTLGSAMAVKAQEYVRSGGMNRREAGEDFYFIQKMALRGGFINLNSTTVYPSSRVSSRVPFGTGPEMARALQSDGGEYRTYHPLLFEPFRELFRRVEDAADRGDISPLCHHLLPRLLASSTAKESWDSKISEVANNSNSREAFIKRFYYGFNTFNIVKHLNLWSDSVMKKVPVSYAALRLAEMNGFTPKGCDAASLLALYRDIDRSSR